MPDDLPADFEEDMQRRFGLTVDVPTPTITYVDGPVSYRTSPQVKRDLPVPRERWHPITTLVVSCVVGLLVGLFLVLAWTAGAR
mgnify:CR=1 FL=1